MPNDFKWTVKMDGLHAPFCSICQSGHFSFGSDYGGASEDAVVAEEINEKQTATLETKKATFFRFPSIVARPLMRMLLAGDPPNRGTHPALMRARFFRSLDQFSIAHRPSSACGGRFRWRCGVRK
ncbi:DNA invertase [Anopheles sinensis]|uniref:DNA invertase n=1 Tax=Anopheles sinensis TaxID=74873 RepID=A0A084WFR6_ANOSI|nr:DNA invertase [Anopheles sinensis]